MVLDGLRARFCSPPAMAISLAPKSAPTMVLVFGATSSMVLSM